MDKFAQICGGKYFVIPANQRGFSWGKRQVEDLIADLLLAGGKAHYLGPLIVSRTQEADFQDDERTTTVQFTLEDGQQRLTTLFIFANEIRKLMTAKGIHPLQAAELEKFVFLSHNGKQLRLQNEQTTLQEYFRYILLGEPAPSAARVPSMNFIDEAKSEIQQPNGNEEIVPVKKFISFD